MRRLILILALLLPASVADAGEFALGPSGQEQVLRSALLVPDSTWNNATYNATKCLQTEFGANFNTWSDDLLCNNAQNYPDMYFAKGVWLTRMSVVVTSALNAASTGSCAFRLVTDDGATVVSGSEVIVGPGSGNTMDIGTVYTSSFAYRLPAGESVQVEVKNGDQCGAGASCVCGTLDEQNISIWGRF